MDMDPASSPSKLEFTVDIGAHIPRVDREGYELSPTPEQRARAKALASLASVSTSVVTEDDDDDNESDHGLNNMSVEAAMKRLSAAAANGFPSGDDDHTTSSMSSGSSSENTDAFEFHAEPTINLTAMRKSLTSQSQQNSSSPTSSPPRNIPPINITPPTSAPTPDSPSIYPQIPAPSASIFTLPQNTATTTPPSPTKPRHSFPVLKPPSPTKSRPTFTAAFAPPTMSPRKRALSVPPSASPSPAKKARAASIGPVSPPTPTKNPEGSSAPGYAAVTAKMTSIFSQNLSAHSTSSSSSTPGASPAQAGERGPSPVIGTRNPFTSSLGVARRESRSPLPASATAPAPAPSITPTPVPVPSTAPVLGILPTQGQTPEPNDDASNGDSTTPPLRVSPPPPPPPSDSSASTTIAPIQPPNTSENATIANKPAPRAGRLSASLMGRRNSLAPTPAPVLAPLTTMAATLPSAPAFVPATEPVGMPEADNRGSDGTVETEVERPIEVPVDPFPPPPVIRDAPPPTISTPETPYVPPSPVPAPERRESVGPQAPPRRLSSSLMTRRNSVAPTRPAFSKPSDDIPEEDEGEEDAEPRDPSEPPAPPPSEIPPSTSRASPSRQRTPTPEPVRPAPPSPRQDILARPPPPRLSLFGRPSISSARRGPSLGVEADDEDMEIEPNEADEEHIGDAAMEEARSPEPAPEEPVPSMPFYDFLKAADIIFKDNITVTRRMTLGHGSHGLSDGVEPENSDGYSKVDMVNAELVLFPQLENYTEWVQQMTNEMQTLEDHIEVLVLDADTTTPDVIEGWLTEDEDGRELIKEMLATMKTYATLESHAVWYKWRHDLVLSAQAVAEADAEVLHQTVEDLEQLSLESTPLSARLRKEHARIKAELEAERAGIAAVQECNPEDLESLKADIKEQGEQILDKAEEVAQIKSRLAHVSEKLDEVKAQIKDHEGAIDAGNQLVEASHGSTKAEVFRLKGKLEMLQNMHSWKMTPAGSNRIEWEFHNQYKLAIHLISQGGSIIPTPGPIPGKVEFMPLPSWNIKQKQFPLLNEMMLDHGRRALKELNEREQPVSMQSIVQRLDEIWGSYLRIRVQLRILNTIFPPIQLKRDAQDGLRVTVKVMLKPRGTGRADVTFALSQDVLAQWPRAFQNIKREIEVVYGTASVQDVQAAVEEVLAEVTSESISGALAAACTIARDMYLPAEVVA